MNSPSKRRKKNDGSGKPIRRLDYFFAKQTARATPKDAPTNTGPSKPPVDQDNTGLTDEELARKLQEQWDKEDRQQGSNQEPAEPVNSNELYEEPDKVPADTTQDTKGQNGNSELAIREATVENTKAAELNQKKNTLSLQSTASEEDAITANIPWLWFPQGQLWVVC